MSSPSTASLISLLDLDPAGYRSHQLHDSSRAYPETNCYTDILIEFVHALGHEPLAALGCALTVDFEGDQWTFFKPLPEDLERLYGIDIHEMQPYRSLPDQIATQLAAGRTVAVELDAWHLPDTAATSYRTEHVKSSIIAEAIDLEHEVLRYFHGLGYFELRDQDYRGAFRLGGEQSAEILPPYTEIVHPNVQPALEGEQLRAAARELLTHRLRRRPEHNPFPRFGEHLGSELPRLLEADEAAYHAYAFATVRMVGSAFETGACHVRWLLQEAGMAAAEQMMRIVQDSKALSFKLARRRAFDPEPILAQLADAWERAFAALDDVIG